jgi:hypothetical protein
LERLTRSDPLQLGRFTILARIGGGGMGTVYLAEDDKGGAAAVKVVRAELALEDSFRARFRREVEAGRRVSGNCTAKFLDADTFAPAPWLATEFVPGPTLHHEIYSHGPMTGARLVGLAAGLADALASIHRAGLIHRDIKPANIILANDAPKVIDFGVTAATDSTALTSTGALVGSPAYMSPEQARGGTGDVTPAADVFAWASTVVFAGTGAPPFGEGEAASILYRVVHDEPNLEGVDPAILPFVAAALDKDPTRRPTPSELLSGLAVLAEGSPAAALAAPGTGFVPPPPPSAERVLAATWRPPYTVVPPAEATLLEGRELRATVPLREVEPGDLHLEPRGADRVGRRDPGDPAELRVERGVALAGPGATGHLGHLRHSPGRRRNDRRRRDDDAGGRGDRRRRSGGPDPAQRAAATNDAGDHRRARDHIDLCGRRPRDAAPDRTAERLHAHPQRGTAMEPGVQHHGDGLSAGHGVGRAADRALAGQRGVDLHGVQHHHPQLHAPLAERGRQPAPAQPGRRHRAAGQGPRDRRLPRSGRTAAVLHRLQRAGEPSRLIRSARRLSSAAAAPPRSRAADPGASAPIDHPRR